MAVVGIVIVYRRKSEILVVPVKTTNLSLKISLFGFWENIHPDNLLSK